jgi:hypothetical protein
LLGLVLDDMRERMLGKLTREVGFVSGPIPKRAAGAVRRAEGLGAAQKHFEGDAGQRAAGTVEPTLRYLDAEIIGMTFAMAVPPSM